MVFGVGRTGEGREGRFCLIWKWKKKKEVGTDFRSRANDRRGGEKTGFPALLLDPAREGEGGPAPRRLRRKKKGEKGRGGRTTGT